MRLVSESAHVQWCWHDGKEISGVTFYGNGKPYHTIFYGRLSPFDDSDDVKWLDIVEPRPADKVDILRQDNFYVETTRKTLSSKEETTLHVYVYLSVEPERFSEEVEYLNEKITRSFLVIPIRCGIGKLSYDNESGEFNYSIEECSSMRVMISDTSSLKNEKSVELLEKMKGNHIKHKDIMNVMKSFTFRRRD